VLFVGFLLLLVFFFFFDWAAIQLWNLNVPLKSEPCWAPRGSVCDTYFVTWTENLMYKTWGRAGKQSFQHKQTGVFYSVFYLWKNLNSFTYSHTHILWLFGICNVPFHINGYVWFQIIFEELAQQCLCELPYFKKRLYHKEPTRMIQL
jgi:hypothetical protein